MNTRMLIRILFGVPAIVLGVPLIVLGLITELTRPLSIMGAFGLIGFFRWTNPEKYLKSRSDLVHALLFISFGLIAILPVVYMTAAIFLERMELTLGLGMWSILGLIGGLHIEVDLIRQLRAYPKGDDLPPLS